MLRPRPTRNLVVRIGSSGASTGNEVSFASRTEADTDSIGRRLHSAKWSFAGHWPPQCNPAYRSARHGFHHRAFSTSFVRTQGISALYQQRKPLERRRLDREMARDTWAGIQKQLEKDRKWQLTRNTTEARAPIDVREVIELLRVLTGVHGSSVLEASQSVVLDAWPYRTSADDFGPLISWPPASLRPIAPVSPADYAAIKSIFEFLIIYFKRTGLGPFTNEDAHQVLEMRLYASFSVALREQTAQQEAVDVVRQWSRSLSAWEFRASTLQMLVNLRRMCHDAKPSPLLYELIKREVQLNDLVPTVVTDFCAFQLLSANREDRENARDLLTSYVFSEEKTAWEALPPIMLAGVLHGLVRSRHGAAESELAHTLAVKLQNDVEAMPPRSGDAAIQFCIEALTMQCALSESSVALQFRRGSRLQALLAKLGALGHLRDQSTQSAVQCVLLRLRADQLDQCRTEPEVAALIADVVKCFPKLKPGLSSWGWGVRTLLGESSSLIRTKPDSRSDSKDLDLLQAHEAKLLYDRAVSLHPNEPPPPFLSWLMIQTLMQQFPPQIDEAMSIFRSMQSDRSQATAGLSPFRIFSRIGRGQASSGTVTDGNPAGKSAPDLDVDAFRNFVEGLFACGAPGMKYVGEVLQALVTSRSEQVLTQCQRVRYTNGLLPLLGDEEATDFWAEVADTRHVGKEAGWCADWTSATWQWLLHSLMGIEQPDEPTERQTGTDARVKQSASTSESLDAPLRVSLPLFMRVVHSAMQSQQKWDDGLFIPILVKLTHMARHTARKSKEAAETRTARDDETLAELRQRERTPSLPSICQAVELLHDLIAQTRGLQPTAVLLNALMNAYNHLAIYGAAYQIWDALALASTKSHGSELENFFQERPQKGKATDGFAWNQDTPDDYAGRTTMNGATLAILLDTVSRHGPAERGVRAWKFAADLDASFISRLQREMSRAKKLGRSSQEVEKRAWYLAREGLLRNTNAWNSWLELLCRNGRLHFALEQLDVMKDIADNLALPCAFQRLVRPDGKTLGTLLTFAGKFRAAKLKAMADKGGNSSQENDSRTVLSGAEAQHRDITAWLTLRMRVRLGDFGPGVWEEVKDAGASPDDPQASGQTRSG